MIRQIFLLISFIAGLSSTTIAQEKYFNELRGFEDSTGTTHLFYRMFDEYTYDLVCSDVLITFFTTENHIYHLNTETESDTLKFRASFGDNGCVGNLEGTYTMDYAFYSNDPNEWIKSVNGYCGGYYIEDYQGRSTWLELPCITKRMNSYNYELNEQDRLILSNSNDTLYYNFNGYLIKYAISDSIYPNYGAINDDVSNEFIESLKPSIDAIHPEADSIFYRTNDDDVLFISENFGAIFEHVDTDRTTYLAFDSLSTIVYSAGSTYFGGEYTSTVKISNDYGRSDSWQLLDFPLEIERIRFLITNPKKSGEIYLSTDEYVYFSDDYGVTFSIIFSDRFPIKGIYKKPDSHIIYVLTNEELIELNIETNEQTILKVLPVSIDDESESPSIINLHQNYPNPFNPSTVISYQLSENSFVSLKVYDALGREVAVLEEELKSAGNHVATFNANNLSSGIYYYVLDADDSNHRIIKKMTLIK